MDRRPSYRVFQRCEGGQPAWLYLSAHCSGSIGLDWRVANINEAGRPVISTGPSVATVTTSEDGGDRGMMPPRRKERSVRGQNAPPPPNELAWEPPGSSPEASNRALRPASSKNSSQVITRATCCASLSKTSSMRADAGVGNVREVLLHRGRESAPIDSKGGSRNHVILGTGLVVGGEKEDSVEPKENIGSKKFGLRSSSVWQPHSRSLKRPDGVLDLPAMGTQLLKDAGSRGRRGVSVHVRTPQSSSNPSRHSQSKGNRGDGSYRGRVARDFGQAGPSGRPPRKSRPHSCFGTYRSRVRLATRSRDFEMKVKGVSEVRRIGRLNSIDCETREPAACRFPEVNSPARSQVPPNTPTFALQLLSRPGGALRVCVLSSASAGPD